MTPGWLVLGAFITLLTSIWSIYMSEQFINRCLGCGKQVYKELTCANEVCRRANKG